MEVGTFTGYSALIMTLAMPADGTTDERQHLERAYGAVTGHLLATQVPPDQIAAVRPN